MMAGMAIDAAATRIAREADRAVLAGVLARAFATDPIMRWVLPSEARYARSGQTFFDWSLRRLVPQGVTWSTTDFGGAALWALPGQWRETPREALALALRMTRPVGRRAPLVLRGLGAVERVHPKAPHLYLSVLGVDPSRQGQGLGSALIRPGLDHADAAGLPAYLETGKAENIPFYERHGFAVTGEHRLPRGPLAWTMWRDARR